MSVRRARTLPFLGFRYSTTRDAYVLRGVGNHFGPVYQVAVNPRSESVVSAEAEAESVHAS